MQPIKIQCNKRCETCPLKEKHPGLLKLCRLQYLTATTRVQEIMQAIKLRTHYIRSRLTVQNCSIEMIIQNE